MTGGWTSCSVAWGPDLNPTKHSWDELNWPEMIVSQNSSSIIRTWPDTCSFDRKVMNSFKHTPKSCSKPSLKTRGDSIVIPMGWLQTIHDCMSCMSSEFLWLFTDSLSSKGWNYFRSSLVVMLHRSLKIITLQSSSLCVLYSLSGVKAEHLSNVLNPHAALCYIRWGHRRLTLFSSVLRWIISVYLNTRRDDVWFLYNGPDVNCTRSASFGLQFVRLCLVKTKICFCFGFLTALLFAVFSDGCVETPWTVEAIIEYILTPVVVE